MSIQTALYAALSGLRSTQLQAATVSHNISNATTPGFVRKELDITASFTGGHGDGVRVEGIARRVDEMLIRDARFEQSRYTAQEARASALSQYTDVLGQPQDERSVATAVAKLQQTFSQLHGQPEDEAAQQAVVDRANGLARSIRDTASAATTAQADAVERMKNSVEDVNKALVQISQLNQKISYQEAIKGDSTDLRDQRDRLLDSVSQEIGIRTYTREDGQVVVMTRNGQTLLDRELAPGAQPLQVNQTAAGFELTAGGKVISANPEQDIQSGRIMGYVQVATQDMPKVLKQLDTLAAGLVKGFQDAEADPTKPGLFVDGNPPTPASTDGLATRLQVNSVVQGNSWRVQSGMQAATPLPPGDQTQIKKYLAVFKTSTGFTAPDTPGTATLGDFAKAMVSTQQGYRTTAESDMKSRKISADVLESARINRDGVNIDTEMQKLQLIEQSYGASAQVIQVAGRMLDTLLQLRN
ncbi:flagellar hook-associated protein FlgK [Azospirillum thermophilum]|uniref:Flagellar hook-associated protein 1 n=1 Tax=Azospirillum thermophilum TaxID=2202148 RepID=A0A2S2CUT2_9PROT|nr:flagellar hook-associated protein FlgK [Azospirillum thermophilum]AWK88248.1 flagellar hook-associated protein FlgK [Azospirillum thermophilum]